ncbi:hypothetical protein WMY93_005360 [Mugilogobius chulae]|uniref:UPAR/Ly6 domain-containing protein n=1 Tax=Mugilogobius chulae TaxID=88201 RepID=A0AAW0PRL5_9GOBI
MKFCLILIVNGMILSGVGSLQCLTCYSVNPGSCTQIWNCPRHYDRCATTLVAENLVTKECMRSDICNNVVSLGVFCCSGDLCNSAQHTRSLSPLLLGIPVIAAVIMHI